MRGKGDKFSDPPRANQLCITLGPETELTMAEGSRSIAVPEMYPIWEVFPILSASSRKIRSVEIT